MEQTTNPFQANVDGTQDKTKIMKLVGLAALLLIVAGVVWYIMSMGTADTTTPPETTPPITETESATPAIPVSNQVDLSVVENDIDQTAKNLDTIDTLENL